MDTETVLEQCILVAHRINKLGGCIFIDDISHIDYVEFRIAEDKKNHASTSSYKFSYNCEDGWLIPFLEKLEVIHRLMEETK